MTSDSEESRTTSDVDRVQDEQSLRDIYAWLGTKYGAVYDGCVPRDYVAFDLETLGGSHSDTLITMVGHCVVEDGEPKFYEGILLNWYDYDRTDAVGNRIISHGWLDRRLKQLQYSMGDKWHGITSDALRERGKHPEEVLEYVLGLFEQQRERRAIFAAHNLLRTDAPILTNNFREFLGADWSFYDDEILDTAAVEKAAAISVMPHPHETVSEYYRRVLGIRSPVKYGVDTCIAKYALDQQYDLQLDQRHKADLDALLVHYIVEEHREITGC